jgi:ABC-type antimicrobial peptide transport system permease subunit
MIDLNRSPISGKKALTLAMKEGLRDIRMYIGRSFLIVLSVASGVALAIAIIAVANGVDDQVKSLLQLKFLPPQINLKQIQQTLDQAREALTWLALIFSGCFVGMVTWISLEQRRYSVSVKRARGTGMPSIITEFLLEAFILCVLGGLAGWGLGILLCQWIPHRYPLLPIHFRWEDSWYVFPEVALFSWLIASGITFCLALRPKPQPQR